MASPLETVRIAFCITDLDPGEAERALVQLVARLNRARWEPAVFCLAGEGPLAGQLRAAGVRVVCLGASHWPYLGAMARLVRELQRFQPAILQTFLFHANLAGRVAAKMAGVRSVISGIRVAEKRSRFPLSIDRWTNRLVKVNVCVSQAVADFSVSEARLPCQKVVVIPNGVDVANFANARPADLSAFGISPESRVFVSIGRLDRQKGFDDLIKAAALVIPSHPEAHFVIAGEGPERERLSRLITGKNMADRVHLAGWRADISELLAASYALVLPSLWEGMPNVVLEAMAAGLPIVATRVEGVPELVVDGQTGLLVAPHDAPALATAVETLLADPKAARAMGSLGQKRVAAEFTWEQMTARYEELYSRFR